MNSFYDLISIIFYWFKSLSVYFDHSNCNDGFNKTIKVIENKLSSQNIPFTRNQVIQKFKMLNGKCIGLFAKRDIKKGEIIFFDESLTFEGENIKLIAAINDLNYYHLMQKYDYEKIENIDKNTNIRQIYVFGNYFFVQAIKDIKKGEELSKLYSTQFWFDNSSEIDISQWYKTNVTY